MPVTRLPNGSKDGTNRSAELSPQRPASSTGPITRWRCTAEADGSVVERRTRPQPGWLAECIAVLACDVWSGLLRRRPAEVHHGQRFLVMSFRVAARPRNSPIGTAVRRALLLLVAALGCAACVPEAALGGGAFCAAPSASTPFSSEPPPPAGAPREERTAALLGVRALLAKGLHDEATKIYLLSRVEEARLTIAGTRAELDCAGERAKQAADYLAQSQQRAVHALTVGSIAAAAATTIVSVFLSTGQTSTWTQNGFAIGGGAVTAGLGLASLQIDGHVRLDHPRNPLADVWFGPKESSVFPPVVWGYLTQPEFSNDQRQPIRANLVDRWIRFQGIRKDDPKIVALLFGAGGTYDEKTLRMRASMIDQLKAEVDLMNQDIAALAARVRAAQER
jgi:hypothetical protein